jgi:nudix-type nucleoside diphosphatase (YffH/AdpP family)
LAANAGAEINTATGPEDEMSGSRKVEMGEPKPLLNDFFQVDEVYVAHERRDGTMSPKERRLVFERGDSVAVILLNLDAKSVVLVNQFKVPSLIARRRDDPNIADGWITETTAGMIDAKETPEQAIIRETEEETGYRIRNPKLITKFFSSPGGTSERIFLYFAEVRESDRIGEGGGLDGEDITVLQVPLDDLLQSLAQGSIDDPKLAIGAYWLRDYLKTSADRSRLVASVQMTVTDLFERLAKGSIENPRLEAAARWLRQHLAEDTMSPLAAITADNRPPPPSGPLSLSTVRYRLKDRPDLVIGYKTGPIDGINDVDIWVNSENTNMLMDRFIGRSISARIRYLGSNRDEEGNVLEDTILEALRTAVGPRGHVKIGTVLATEPGLLKAAPHRVQRIFHVATVEADPGAAMKGRRDKLQLCVQTLLARAERENKRMRNIILNFFRSSCNLKANNCESILIPMMGAGEGGLRVDEVAQIIIPPAIDHLRTVQLPTLKEIYFLAFAAPAKNACDSVFGQYRAQGALIPLDGE